MTIRTLADFNAEPASASYLFPCISNNIPHDSYHPVAVKPPSSGAENQPNTRVMRSQAYVHEPVPLPESQLPRSYPDWRWSSEVSRRIPQPAAACLRYQSRPCLDAI